MGKFGRKGHGKVAFKISVRETDERLGKVNIRWLGHDLELRRVGLAVKWGTATR